MEISKKEELNDIDLQKVIIKEQIGCGTGGEVYKAIYQENKILCVKRFYDTWSSEINFLKY